MGKIDIVFLETPLEIKYEGKKKSNKELLDISIHYKQMLKLKNFLKRGRPDIIHHSLLNILEKPFVINGNVNIYMHIYDGRVFKFKNDVRIPKNYDRFKGLMYQLLEYNKVPPNSNDPLIYLVSKNLKEFLGKNRKIILLRESGEETNVENILKLASKLGYPIGIGAFAHGDFSDEVKLLSFKEFSLYKGFQFKTWDIACFLSSKLMEIEV